MSPSDRLKQIVKQLGLTQQDIADRFGVDRSLLSKLYNGKQSISKLFLYALKSEFNVNPTWLLTGEGEMFLPGREKTSPPGPLSPGRGEANGGLTGIDGDADIYPDITDVEQVAHTAWYENLSKETKDGIAALCDIKNRDFVASVVRTLLKQAAAERAEEAAADEIDAIAESVLRQKREAG